MLEFKLKVKQNYVICRVVFPPRFPLVPPIFSVASPDASAYVVHRRFDLSPLPSNSYEIRLFQAKKWKKQLNVDEVVQDYFNFFYDNFPFVARQGEPLTEFPLAYDSRYNDETEEFPTRSKKQLDRNYPVEVANLKRNNLQDASSYQQNNLFVPPLDNLGFAHAAEPRNLNAPTHHQQYN